MKDIKHSNKRKHNRRTTIKELRRLKKSGRQRPEAIGGHQSKPPLQIDLPQNFQMSGNFSETAGSILNLRGRLAQKLRGGRPPYINFNSIAAVDNAAALMLAAEIHAWNLANPHIKLRSHDSEWDPEVADIFDEMGLFELLRVSRQGSRAPGRARDTIFFPFLHGSRTDLLGDSGTFFLDKIKQHIKVPIQRLSLFVGVGEAVANAWEHGYNREDGAEWWVSASCNQKTGELKVLCYDRGLTIPGTLPRSSKWENIRDTLESWGMDLDSDSNLIRAALVTRRTKTKRLRRGRGLPNLMLFINKCGQGKLSIHSRRGMVSYTKEGFDQEGIFKTKQLDKMVRGTLIEWRVFAPTGGGTDAE